MTDTPWMWTAIMRHGEAFRPGMDPARRPRHTALTDTGLGEAAAVARRLKEALREDGISPATVAVVRAPSDEARQTAAALTEELGAPRATPLWDLGPSSWTARSVEHPAERWMRIESEIAVLRGSGRACIVVGHDPQVSWLLHHLVEVGQGAQRGAGPLPLGRGELAMLAGPPGKPRLRYVLSPSDDKLIEQLQAKIKSKMDSAKLLGAFLTALLLVAARELANAENAPGWYPWVGGAGLGALAIATAAYFVTMFRYDELLMPVRFWPSPRRAGSRLPRGFAIRPPSSAAWVLYQNMMRVWLYAFVPATVLGGAGAVAITVALVRPHDSWWIVVCGSIAAVIAVTFAVSHAAKPNLGVSD